MQDTGIRHATEADLDAVMRITAAAVAIMNAQGNVQWNETYPLRADFLRDVRENTLYACVEDGLVRGVACLNFNEPAEYRAANWTRHGRVMVLHRMVVDPECRRKGIAAALLSFAVRLAEENGAVLRTDTFSGNAPMNALLLKYGFHMTGAIELAGKRQQPFCCYEYITQGDNT